MSSPSSASIFDSSLDPDSVSRRQIGTLTTAVTVALAGCSSIFGGDDSPGGETSRDGELRYVPESADGVVHSEKAMLTDESRVTIASGTIERGTGLFDEVAEGQSYVDLLVKLVDSERVTLRSGLQFYSADEETDKRNEALLVESQSSETVIEWVESEYGELELVDSDGIEIYATGETGQTGWLATIDSEVVVIGRRDALEDVVAVANGESEPIDGDIRIAFEHAGTGPMRATIELAEGEFVDIVSTISPELAQGLGLALEDPSVLTMKFDGPEGDSGEDPAESILDLQLTMADEADADAAIETLEPILEAEELPLEIDIIDQLSLQRDGRHVTIRLTAPMDELVGYFGGSQSAVSSPGRNLTSVGRR